MSIRTCLCFNLNYRILLVIGKRVSVNKNKLDQRIKIYPCHSQHVVVFCLCSYVVYIIKTNKGAVSNTITIMLFQISMNVLRYHALTKLHVTTHKVPIYAAVLENTLARTAK